MGSPPGHPDQGTLVVVTMMTMTMTMTMTSTPL